MRTIEKYVEKRQYILKNMFPPMICSILKEIPCINRYCGSKNFFITGDVYTGKTIKASLIAEQILIQNYLHSPNSMSFCFFNWSDIYLLSLDEQKKTIENCIKTDILFIDDLAVSGISDWLYNSLYQIINNRLLYEKITIITSNSDLEKLEKIFQDSRICSRIERHYELLKLTKSYRK